LTIGTLDGANVEIRDAVGHENFFLFGLTVEEVQRTLAEGYRPWDIYREHTELRTAIDLLRSGLFSHGDRDLFHPLTESLIQHDPYLLLADYPAYVETQNLAGTAFRDVQDWTRMSILNTARMGYFSSDRAIREYCEKIWRVQPVPVSLTTA
jgi:glycogen phosphorylase